MAKMKRLGDLLVEKGILSVEKLQEALKEQRRTGKRLGEVIQEMELVVEDQILDVLSQQLDVPKTDLFKETFDPDLLGKIDPEVIQRHKSIPIRVENGRLLLAMVDPLNFMAMDDFRLATGFEIRPLLCSEKALERIFLDKFGVSHEADKHIKEWTQDQIKSGETLQQLLQNTASFSEMEDAPIVKFVQTILEGAVDHKASDIHLEPKEDGMAVRYRVDGMLHKITTVPMAAMRAVTARLKILAGLDTSERRRPQDGRIDLRVRDAEFDIRFSTLPTIHGEKIVMRLLDKTKILFTLEELGFEAQELSMWENLIKNPHGIIYITGPTGSGKSSTLIASLAKVASDLVNVTTVEEPVEYQLKTINQVSVNRKVDLTFATVLRTILRQDPDIIMVGETRDRETAELAIQAALTGHLVFSTLHTNDAAGGLIRLNHMGVERFLIVASVIAMVAQRLIRKICRSCRIPYAPDEDTLRPIRHYLEEEWLEGEGLRWYRPNGCNLCNNLGYSGRQACYEILPVSGKVREMVMGDASVHQIKQQAISDGMNTLFKSGVIKVNKGITALEDLYRVARPEEDEAPAEYAESMLVEKK